MKIWIPALVSLWVSTAFGEGPAPAILESVAGSPEQIKITGPNGESQKAIEGEELHPGTRVKTSSGSAAKILFEDQSELVLGSSSELTLEATNTGSITSTLENGHLRALVSKPSDPDALKKPHRFVIRTASATMGVRGTSFTVDADRLTGKAEVHTLEGSVETGKTLQELRTKPLHRLGPGNSVRAGNTGFTAPERFEVNKFLTEYQKNHPHAHLLASKTARSWKSLRKRRQDLRRSDSPAQRPRARIGRRR